jgi:cytochrome c biogenesis protein CcmG, thiol:disulfide interchange protein DsbE
MRHLARATAALLAALALSPASGCSRPEHPSYTRVEGLAPEPVARTAGATLVVFWATWCPPCVDELPSLRALARDPPPGLSVVTFGQDEEDAPVHAFFGGAPPRELGFRRDLDRRASTAFGVDLLPAAFLVVDGRLVARFSGPREWSSPGMRRLLARLAREAPPSPPTGAPPGVDGARGSR